MLRLVCDLETSRIGAAYIYDISNLRVKRNCIFIKGLVMFGSVLVQAGDIDSPCFSAEYLTCLLYFDL